MNRQHILVLGLTACMVFALACGNSGNDSASGGNNSETTTSEASNQGTDPKGIGPHQNIQLTHPLDEKMIATGENVYNVKCASCHKLSDERLVGPGWKGVTDRRTPEWIMNFVTNTDEMIEKDTAAQNMLEVCLVKMPNQGLTENDARSTLEFMRKNDGKQ